MAGGQLLLFGIGCSLSLSRETFRFALHAAFTDLAVTMPTTSYH
jgi:hypothetical protein